MFCPKCQTENPKGAKFCRGCGKALQSDSSPEGAIPTSTSEASPQQPAKGGKPLTIIGIVLILFLVIITLGALIAIRRFRTRLATTPSSTPTTTPAAPSTPAPTPEPTPAPTQTEPTTPPPTSPSTPPSVPPPALPSTPDIPMPETPSILQCYEECQSRGYSRGGACFSGECYIGDDIGQAGCTEGRCCCLPDTLSVPIPSVPEVPTLKCIEECQSKGYSKGGYCSTEECFIGEEIGEAGCEGGRCCCLE